VSEVSAQNTSQTYFETLFMQFKKKKSSGWIFNIIGWLRTHTADTYVQTMLK